MHEWGTFTSLQDEGGNALTGLNSDDEVLPDFTHDLSPNLIARPALVASKIAGPCHPDVTMRLETPVIYFHPQGGAWKQPVDVHVDFLGGWLTQFYPAADHPAAFGAYARITAQTDGWLAWKGLALGGAGEGPATDARVWNAPRAVDAAAVTTPEGEHEKFLFYRGVGNLDSPLRVTRGPDGMLQLKTQFGFASSEPMPIHAVWLAEFREHGECAFRALGPMAGSEHPVATQGSFADRDFAVWNSGLLRSAMQAALVKEGLYADEAAAVLNTWELSYFKSGGMRLFFLVPRAWTDHYLPLKISGTTDITRVMVGRIELVSPGQRETLARLGVTPTQEDYAALGRFKSALLLDEEKKRPTRNLEVFISAMGLTQF